jgi:hypothetical protein
MGSNNNTLDWGVASETFDVIREPVGSKNLSEESEAQTRFDVIDRLIREVLDWKHGQIYVEENDEGIIKGRVDYILRSGDNTIIIEAKRIGASFPSPTKKKKLKISGAVLGSGEIREALNQARRYAASKDAQVAIATNGLCWCFFSMEDEIEDAYAGLLFPFSSNQDAKELFDLFGRHAVENGSLSSLNNLRPPAPENRLLSMVRDADARVDRNNIADHIAPALNKALYADALLHNAEDLERCFIQTEARIKFDSMLGVFICDPKPEYNWPRKLDHRLRWK